MNYYLLFKTTITCLLVARLTNAFVGIYHQNPIVSKCANAERKIKTSPTYDCRRGRNNNNNVVILAMESDFASAMPDKPPMSIEEKLISSAREFVDNVRGNLGEGVAEPPELKALDDLCNNYDTLPSKESISICIYELMIETGMMYDRDPETGIMTPTEFGGDLGEKLDIPEVKAEFKYLYSYGMSLISKKMVDINTMKEVVLEKLIARTGLEPKKFDEWLGY